VSWGQAGAGAGAIASAITNPFDVTKTLLNTQELLHERQRISGVRAAFGTVYRTAGIQGFAKGIGARIALGTPATAVSWSVYEFLKYVLPMSDD
jgi:solute carrier family 25 iron transporter 28/37